MMAHTHIWTPQEAGPPVCWCGARRCALWWVAERACGYVVERCTGAARGKFCRDHLHLEVGA